MTSKNYLLHKHQIKIRGSFTILYASMHANTVVVLLLCALKMHQIHKSSMALFLYFCQKYFNSKNTFSIISLFPLFVYRYTARSSKTPHHTLLYKIYKIKICLTQETQHTLTRVSINFKWDSTHMRSEQETF